jgi:hypothetical protein
MLGEETEHANQLAAADQRVSSEGDHALSCRPLGVAHQGIVDDVVGHMWLKASRNRPDLVGPDGNSAVRTINVRVPSGARW